LEDIALQILQNGTYLDLESTLEEQADVLDGFPDRYPDFAHLYRALF
jgi:hypothetical protein